ncbi:ovarian cancer G-protein coupled receptor 1 [Clupea harengus]|uniref:Ovarian cancer G-protein coupled receptor 1 n=1 Tax=Clupea harengus TaxID=7950 RepID=A0A6P3VPJ8_CLUHA|nr:ovarian cancer G-protein coupled receptor 1 [Clupea harengus]
MNSTAELSNHSFRSKCHPEGYPGEHLIGNIFAFLYIAIVILGFPSNCFSVFVSYQHIRQGNAMGVYLMNLALADLFFIMMLPIWVDNILAEEWRHGGFACNLCVFLLFTHFYASVSMLCCIAVDRYMAVVHPLRFPYIRKLGTVVGVCVLSWTCTMAFNCITVSHYVYDDTDKICLYAFPMPLQAKVNIARFFAWFLVPSLLVGFCCWKTSKEVRSNRATEEEECKRVCRLLWLVQLTLSICFGPFHIMLLLMNQVEDCETLTWMFYLYKVTVILASLNCLADPLLYCFITRSGRASVTKAFLLLQRKDPGNSMEGELKQPFHKP